MRILTAAATLTLLIAAPALSAERCWDAQRMARYEDMLPNYIVRADSAEIEYKLEVTTVGEGRTLRSDEESEMGVVATQVAIMTTMIERAGPGEPLLPKGLVFRLPEVLVPHEGDYETAASYGFRNGLPVAFRFSNAQGELGTLAVGPNAFDVSQRDISIDPGAAKVMLEGMLAGGFTLDVLVDGEVYATATDTRGFYQFYAETIYPRLERFSQLQQQGQCE